MSDINTITISGRLVRDPEARGGGTVAAFSVASGRSFRRQNSETWEEETTFVDCTAFNGTATRVMNKLLKGASVTVTGRIEQNRWIAQDGSKRSQLRIIVQNIVSPAFFTKGNVTPGTTEQAEKTPAEVLETVASDTTLGVRFEDDEMAAATSGAAASEDEAREDDIPF